MASRWVRSEAEEGVEREVLVPVLIEEVRIPLAFRRIQAARLTDWQGSVSDVGFSRLVEALSSFLGPPPSPPRDLSVPRAGGKLQNQRPSQRSSKKRGFEEMEEDAWVAKAKSAEADGDYARAMSIVRPLADQGNAVAQYALGQAYCHGYGVRRDLLEAARRYREAAVQGYAKAQFSLALMYVKYLGMPEDLDNTEPQGGRSTGLGAKSGGPGACRRQRADGKTQQALAVTRRAMHPRFSSRSILTLVGALMATASCASQPTPQPTPGNAGRTADAVREQPGVRVGASRQLGSRCRSSWTQAHRARS